MLQVYTNSKALRANGVKWFSKLPLFFFVAFTFASAIWPNALSAQTTHEDVFVEFKGTDTPPDGCIKIDSPNEALSCYWDNGFPYASLCPQPLFFLQEKICPGPRVRIADFNFSDEMPLRKSLIQLLGGFERDQYYNHQQVLDFIVVLRDRFSVEDAEITFEQAGLNSVRMIIDGRLPTSAITSGLHIDSFDGLVGRLTGRHFKGGNAPGFIEYYLQGAANGSGEIGASIPLSVHLNRTTRLSVSSYDTVGRYANLKGTALRLNVVRHFTEAEYFAKFASFDLEIVTEKYNSPGFIPKHDHYLGAFTDLALNGTNIFEYQNLRLGVYFLEDQGVTSKLSFSASNKKNLWDDSRAILRSFSNLEIMFGSISRSPLSERIFLGGQNLRGFYAWEVGRKSNGGFDDWGEKLSLSSQIELLWPIYIDGRDVFLGVHADLGITSNSNLDMDTYGSIGLMAEIGVSKGAKFQLTLSRNSFHRNRIGLYLEVSK